MAAGAVPIPQGATLEPIQQASGQQSVQIPQGSKIEMLEPKPGETYKIPEQTIGHAVKSFGSDLWDSAKGLFKTITAPPQTDQEKTTAVLYPGGGVPMLRIGKGYFDSVRHLLDNAEKAGEAGDTHGVMINSIAAGLPLVGPLTGDIYEQAKKGDMSGAIGKGTSRALQVLSMAPEGSVIPNPAAAAIKGTVAGAAKVAPALAPAAEKLYQSALKPSTTNTPAEISTLVKTGLENEIPISKAGADKLTTLIDDLNGKIKAKIKAGSDAGITVDPNKVATRLDPLKAKYQLQANPDADLSAIDASKQEFLRTQGAKPGAPAQAPRPTGLLDAKGNPIMDQGTPAQPAQPAQPMSAMKAQQIKQGTYAQLRKKYGELSSAADESQKSLARGIREELDQQFPEVKNLNAQDAKLIGLEPEIFKAVNRIGNRNWFSIGGKITGIAAGTAVGGEAGFGAATAAAVMHEVLSNPMVQSRLAISLSKAAKIRPSVAAAKVSAYVNSLAAANASTSQRSGGQDSSAPSE